MPIFRPIAVHLVFSFCLPVAVWASPQDIVVRLVNARSAKPLSKVSVVMTSWSGDPTFDPHQPHERAVTTTDTEGRAVFHLPQPIPEHLGFMLEPPTDFSGCWRPKSISPELVLHSGVVAGYDESTCGKLKQQITPKPGEVIIFERRLTWWEQLRRELP